MIHHNAPLRDPAAFAQLFEHFHLAVFRFVYGLSGWPLPEVEDITAETFMRAWKARAHFEGDEQAALGWLLTIARRLVIDTSRRKKVRHHEQATQPEDWYEFYPTNQEDNPEWIAIRQEQDKTLLDLLSTLTTGQRDLLVLRYILGWQVKQIAAHMSLSENTTSVYIRRAIEQLRRHWPIEDK